MGDGGGEVTDFLNFYFQVVQLDMGIWVLCSRRSSCVYGEC
jgi:hypothetical protein